ncbi:MAG TPA: glycine radical domain-containing protein [Negativicutes bacterium]|nr:glycine radical domain-containing protein [Negativicutes bacterium]
MGFRYNATYNIETTGTITMVNSLAAMKKLVYEEKKYTLEDMKTALLNNFGFCDSSETNGTSLNEKIRRPDGIGYEDIYADCLMANKYGNADDYTDSILHEYETWLCNAAHNFESLYAKPMYACQISVSSHGLLGSGCMATPDGRLSGTTFADASMSACPGTDKNGPYALFTSATCWDHSRSQNSQMNLKIHPSTIRGESGTKHLAELAKAYLRSGGFHIQFNVVDNNMLIDAQEKPENYRELMVRVAGFTQYWVEIGKPIQDEVIARTEYEGVL